ncbi:MAG: methylmalonyl Co-A mutase-associated GTPase MeaB [Ferruginibacter sp.]|nr:methylmalonyl Co-A mutase-associated GTPase MeaB [Ferruginibacter sp.]
MQDWKSISRQIKSFDIKSLARAISFVENEAEGHEDFLKSLEISTTPIIGITGPPGAGKSTLTDALIEHIVSLQKKVAVLCIDPSSPFNMGALLGDRIRMSEWYNNPNVYIRSLATRGSLGGLNPKIIEISDVIKTAGFDYIIIETVGVGQSEIEIVGLADVTVVAIVPEAGDEIQTMKAGLMEIADVFVVNKSDRPGADAFVNNLRQMLAPAFSTHSHELPIVKTIASQKKGIDELYYAIFNSLERISTNEKKFHLLTEKVWTLILKKRMKDIDKMNLLQEIKKHSTVNAFNLYEFVEKF